MKSVNILVTAVGGDIGTNVINILTQQTKVNFNIFATDINNKVFSQNKLKKFFQVERATHKSYKNQIKKIVLDEQIEIILPLNENEIFWFDKHIKFFDKLKVKVLINNSIIINTFLDKLKTSNALNNISIKTPKTYMLNKYKNQLSFPLIIKALSSITSKNIYIIKNKNELELIQKILDDKEKYLIQEYIGSIDEEYTTTVYKNENTTKVITFHRQLTGGMTSHAVIKPEKKLEKYAKKIANEFNLNGSINIQSRKVDGTFYIFEINPRLSSTVFIRNYFGFNDLLWWISDSMNLNLIKEDIKVKKQGEALIGYTYSFF
jgi:carbamoyl-phosphate synthase large subunit